jgi:hypothetical protein
MLRPSAILSLLLLAALAAEARAYDRVMLKDGRIINGKLIDSEDDQYYLLRLPGADVPISTNLVDRIYVEDMEDYVPKNSKEAKYLKQGKVLFEGSWMSRTRREQALQGRKDADKEAIDKLRTEQKWKNQKTMSTRHFLVHSNATQEVMEMYANLLEDYYKSFIDYWNIKLSASDGRKKMEFFFYRSKDDFHYVTNTGRNLGGFFNFIEGNLQLYDVPQDRDYAKAILLHEGNHLLTYLIDTRFRYPIWLNEGMAEYYGTAKIDDQGNFELGGLQFSRIVSLRIDAQHDRSIGLRELLTAGRGTFNARHYAVAWSFVHFLMESREYGKSFRAFFKNLPKNNMLDINVLTYPTRSFDNPTLASVLLALEKQLGESLEELEVEWTVFTEQAYGELNATAYYRAAKSSLYQQLDEDEHIVNAMEFFQKAVDLGIQDANCFREYAEMLRKGGVMEGRYTAIIKAPNPEKAYKMAARAIELDPIGPLNYCEAAAALMMDGPAQDLDNALAMAETALALAPRSFSITSLTDELLSKIEPARERRANRAEHERQLAENDNRLWMFQAFFRSDEEPSEIIDNLSTVEMLELVQSGTAKGRDWVFQTWRAPDPETGDLTPGIEPWDLGWTEIKEVPVFADALPQDTTEEP